MNLTLLLFTQLFLPGGTGETYKGVNTAKHYKEELMLVFVFIIQLSLSFQIYHILKLFSALDYRMVVVVGKKVLYSVRL